MFVDRVRSTSPFNTRTLSLTLACIWMLRCPIARAQTPPPPSIPIIPPSVQTLYAPIAGIDEFTSWQLTVVNRTQQPMPASIILYSSEGNPFPVNSINLSAEETRRIDITTLLPKGAQDRNIGGLAISFLFNLPTAIGAQITISGYHGFGSIDLPVFPDAMYKSNDGDAVWLEPRGAKSFLILGNSSASRLHAAVTYADGSNREIDVDAHATVLEPIPAAPNNSEASQSNINSFHLSGSVGAGTLRISGFTASVDDKYVDTIRSFDPKASVEPAVYANGLHFSGGTNHLVVKNLTSQALSVSGSLYPISTSESGKPLAIPAQQLAAYSAAEIDLTKIPSGQSLDGVAIKLEANGPPASLIAGYSSHDASTNLTRSVPFKSLGDPSLTNGAYPWRLDGQFQSRIYITNVGSAVGKIAATIRPENGSPFAIDTRAVQPGETAVYDLRQMRDEQTVDPNGVKLPKNATVGQFDWTTLFNDGTQRFIGRNEVVDASSGISASFSCPTCSCPASYVSGFANPANLVVSQGGMGNVVATGVSSCSGTVTLTNFSTIASSWTYGTPDVVQLTTGATPSVLTGMAAGSSSFTTTQTGNLIVYEGPITGCVTMPPPQVPITGGGCVGTAIGLLNPAQGGVGTTVPVMITGCGFSTTATNNTINAGSGITATVSPEGSNGTSLNASFAILPTAVAGAVQVSVTVTNGEGGSVTTNPLSFTVAPVLAIQGNRYNSIFVGTDPNLVPANSIYATVSPPGGTFTETSSVSGDTFSPVTAGGPGWVVNTTTPSTAVVDRKLTFAYTVNGVSAPPFSLNVTARQFAYATNNSPSNVCTLGHGTKQVYTYTPYTHPDKIAVQSELGLSGTVVTESFSPQPPTGAVIGSGALNANDQFSDTIAYCSTSALSSLPTVTQTLFIEGYQVRQNTLQFLSTGVTYTSLGPTK